MAAGISIPPVAIGEARRLAAAGADVIDLGAAASNIAAKPVAAADEIRRLAPVIMALTNQDRAVSSRQLSLETQRFALRQRVDFLNDIQGFADPGLYPDLAASSVPPRRHACGAGTRPSPARAGTEIWPRIEAFFAARIAALEAAGIARTRLVLDPGMGFFLSSDPKASLRALTGIGRLKRAFGLPVMISVSRKSFWRR